MDFTQLADDQRPIRSAWGEDGQTGASVGMRGVTKIKAYWETGQMAGVGWLAVYKGDTIVARLNAARLTEIVYEDATATSPNAKGT